MKEEDIRPQEVFDEYLRLTEADIQKFFMDVPRIQIDCPACGKQMVAVGLTIPNYSLFNMIIRNRGSPG